MRIAKVDAMRDRCVCGVDVRFIACNEGQVAFVVNLVVAGVKVESVSNQRMLTSALGLAYG